jgi:hypothetical protein
MYWIVPVIFLLVKCGCSSAVCLGLIKAYVVNINHCKVEELKQSKLFDKMFQLSSHMMSIVHVESCCLISVFES